MLVGSVVENEIENNLHPLLVSLRDQTLAICERPIWLVNISEV